MQVILLKSLSILVFVAGLLLGCTGCDTVDDVMNPKMPAATQEGTRPFSCMAGGKLWLPYHPNAGSVFLGNYAIRTYSLPVNSSTFSGVVNNLREENTGVTNSTFFIRFTSAIRPGVYALSNGFSAGASLGAALFHTDNVGTGNVTITKVEPFTRTVNGIMSHQSIVSGTFEFTAAGAGTANGKTLTVTKGRFDLSPPQQAVRKVFV